MNSHKNTFNALKQYWKSLRTFKTITSIFPKTNKTNKRQILERK
ncbi:unnamed protein product [Lasius platythorax]|uniref:Uncharacterized protein n=1 Tax=Lasius platythorax TaxID=488582 RepID=A0AAV2P6U4_9HYME